MGSIALFMQAVGAFALFSFDISSVGIQCMLGVAMLGCALTLSHTYYSAQDDDISLKPSCLPIRG